MVLLNLVLISSAIPHFVCIVEGIKGYRNFYELVTDIFMAFIFMALTIESYPPCTVETLWTLWTIFVI